MGDCKKRLVDPGPEIMIPRISDSIPSERTASHLRHNLKMEASSLVNPKGARLGCPKRAVVKPRVEQSSALAPVHLGSRDFCIDTQYLESVTCGTDKEERARFILFTPRLAPSGACFWEPGKAVRPFPKPNQIVGWYDGTGQGTSPNAGVPRLHGNGTFFR